MSEIKQPIQTNQSNESKKPMDYNKDKYWNFARFVFSVNKYFEGCNEDCGCTFNRRKLYLCCAYNFVSSGMNYEDDNCTTYIHFCCEKALETELKRLLDDYENIPIQVMFDKDFMRKFDDKKDDLQDVLNTLKALDKFKFCRVGTPVDFPIKKFNTNNLWNSKNHDVEALYSKQFAFARLTFDDRPRDVDWAVIEKEYLI